jgi:hypothetical protein
MRYGKLTVGLAIAGTVAGMVVTAVQPAYADYAPTARDVVGVGSDTLQYLMDFVADGDNLGDPGYNTAGNKYKVINFDATADANARLAYGPYGATGNASGDCSPGTGSAAGSMSDAALQADAPCTLNPTIVIRAGVSPVQRPNGSGAGAKALAADSSHYITYTRASACEGPTSGCGNVLSASFDSVQLGTDPLAMLTASTSNAVPLSAAQLKEIYSCTGPGPNGAYAWDDATIGGTSADWIVPIIPQVGSGTRSTFLTDIGLASSFTPPACVQVGEENDPTAIAAQVSPGGSAGAAGTADPQDAIEPMSGGRLNLFLGLMASATTVGASSSNGVGGYFKDPSCPLQDIINGSPASCAGSIVGGPAGANTISPKVTLVTTGTPGGSLGGALFDVNRPLYVYFRDSDVNSPTPFQPGGTLNAIRTLFYNPCQTGQTGCVTVNGTTFGPGGPPYADTSFGETDIEAAGSTPAYVPTVGGP